MVQHDLIGSAAVAVLEELDHFAVLLRSDQDFDEIRTVNRLCTEAKKTLYPDGGKGLLSPFVGRICSDPDKYESFMDILHEADGMFFRREMPLSPEDVNNSAVVKALMNWRKTIF